MITLNKPKVSIIVPVYNVADYLRNCLDSCVNQTLQEIEVIVVNDCSPDPRDSEIMKEYQEKFPNKVKCIWHKENKRQGGARNTGIRAACSEFVYFADSDDYLDLTLCEKMYNAIIQENADMAVCDVTRIEKDFCIKKWYSNGEFNTLDLCERIKNIKMHNIWIIMIRKSVIEDNNLYFPELTVSDDITSILWFLASSKIVRLNEALYYYVNRQNSITNSYNMQSCILLIKTIKYILNLDYFSNLYIPVKKLVFIYLFRLIFKLTINYCCLVCVKFPTEFIKYCNIVLDLFKIYKVDYNDNIYTQVEDGIWLRDMLCFIELNIYLPDFNFEFLAYWNTYYVRPNKAMQLKMFYNRISPYIGKRLTLWGAGFLCKKNTVNMSILGVKFEITDTNSKLHGEIIADVAVKPWNELKEHTDIVLVCAKGIFEEVREKLSKENPNIEVVDLVKIDLEGRK